MSTGLEGRIQITLSQRAGRVAAARIASSRPRVAQKLMAGRTPDEAAHLAGMVFTLCGQAQGIAARLACDAALGLASDTTTTTTRDQAVLMELAREHAWRLLINWPEQAGLAPDLEALLGLRLAKDDPAALAEVLDGLLRERLLGLPAHDWLAGGGAGLDAWIARDATPLARLFAGLGSDAPPDGARDLGISHAPLLPPLDQLGHAGLAELARRALAEPDFCARPVWPTDGGPEQPRETGAIARQQHHPLLAAWLATRGRGAGARQLARLLELALLPDWLRGAAPAMTRATPLAAGTGASGIETSRGLLLHVVRLDADRVTEYRIVAPTEWNFHPAGALLEALSELPAGPGLEPRARLVAQSLDPCVDYGVEVLDA